jgi:hypothetical protein
MRKWHTPSPHRNYMFCPDCLGAAWSEVVDWQAQVYQVCGTCGWNNRPTCEEWIERLRTEYKNYPDQFEDWEKMIIEETLSGYDDEEVDEQWQSL